MWTNIIKLYARKIIFSKKEFQIWDLESLIFWSSFVFQWTALGRFSRCFFLNFCRRPTMVADIFTQPPPQPPPPSPNHHHKKASYSPVKQLFLKQAIKKEILCSQRHRFLWLPPIILQNMFSSIFVAITIVFFMCVANKITVFVCL